MASKSITGRPLATDFYLQDVVDVARGLLGSRLFARLDGIEAAGTIVETEAYGDEADLASHASFRRNGVVRAMWGAPGTLYVYRAFGMYPCFNVVTGATGHPSAVLIRAVHFEPLRNDLNASGPGRLGLAIGLAPEHNGHSLQAPPFWIEPGDTPAQIVSGPRVGVNRGDPRHWRFAVAGHPAVSRPRL